MGVGVSYKRGTPVVCRVQGLELGLRVKRDLPLGSREELLATARGGRRAPQLPQAAAVAPTVVSRGGHKSTPPQIRQLILYYYQYQEQVDGFV